MRVGVTLWALTALIWWACYLTRDHAILELMAALGFTLAWAFAIVQPRRTP